MSVECQECLRVSTAAFGNVWDMSWVICGYLGISECVWGCLRRVGECSGLRGVSGSLFPSFSFNIRKSQSYKRFDLLGSLGRGFRAEL